MVVLVLHIVTQGYHSSQNAVIAFQLHCPYIENVLISTVLTRRKVFLLNVFCLVVAGHSVSEQATSPTSKLKHDQAAILGSSR